MITRDSAGRIIKISQNECIHTGHSVCAYCAADMSVVWDVLCAACGRALCYNCAQTTPKDDKTDLEFWICKPPAIHTVSDARLCCSPCPGFVSDKIAMIIKHRAEACTHLAALRGPA
jgi:hypothetical protein